MLSQLPLLGSDEAGGVLAALVRAGEQESLDQLRSWADYCFAPGDVATFVDAVLDLVPVDAARPRRNSRTHGHPLERWHEVVQSRNPALLTQILAEDATFHSPVLFRPSRDGTWSPCT